MTYSKISAFSQVPATS